jgi:transposase
VFLREKTRFKNGKTHRYFSIVENRRVSGGRVVQKHVLYLGEINDSQKAAWCEAVSVFDEKGKETQLALFPSDRTPPRLSCETVQVRVNAIGIRRPRQWGACWLGLELWNQLCLDGFWQQKLLPSRKGTSWINVLKTLVCYRLIDPGSEWRLHRHWFDQSAMGDLLDEDLRIAEPSTLYRCLDKLLAHKTDLFSHLTERWKTLFDARFDVLLYDLTSTYFECDPPLTGKRQFGYSRDKRSDCVQVVIALIVTPDGFPVAYEVLAGNTSDKTTLKDFLGKIEKQYGKAQRVWVMDRGIPTEELLGEMRAMDPPVSYLVGTPKGRLTKLEKEFLKLDWSKVRQDVDVKLLKQENELYVLARSEGRVLKERQMRGRRLRRLLQQLKTCQAQSLTRDQLLMKLGAAKKEAGRAYGLVDIRIPRENEPLSAETFTFAINRKKLRQVWRREGRYLLRSNLAASDPAQLWTFYIQLTEVEQAFKELKGDLSVRPIYHQLDGRIEAHIFIAFLAYCLHVTLKQRAHVLAPGLTPRSILEKMAAIQMVDVHLPTTDGRTLLLSRYTDPEQDQKLLLTRLGLTLPAQPPPKIKAESATACSADL